jgi:hypothetical protein
MTQCPATVLAISVKRLTGPVAICDLCRAALRLVTGLWKQVDLI